MATRETTNVGRRIREIRENAGLSRKALAEQIQISPSTIRDIETGEKLPRTETLILLCNYFDVTSDVFLQDELKVGYQVRTANYWKQLETLSPEERDKKLALIEAIIAL